MAIWHNKNKRVLWHSAHVYQMLLGESLAFRGERGYPDTRGQSSQRGSCRWSDIFLAPGNLQYNFRYWDVDRKIHPLLNVCFWCIVTIVDDIWTTVTTLIQEVVDWNISWLTDAEWCIYASTNKAIIGSNICLSPARWQAIIWTNAGILSLRNKHQWNFRRSTIIFIEEITFGNVVCKMSAIYIGSNVLIRARANKVHHLWIQAREKKCRVSAHNQDKTQCSITE